MIKWSRVRLVVSILACEGLFSTLRERIQLGAAGRRNEAGCAVPTDLPPLHDYAGVLHIHSTHSDGVGTIRQIAEAGTKAGVDFILMCDHSNLDAIALNEDGWYGKCLVMVGTEVTTDSGHLLAVGVPLQFLPTVDSAEAVQESIIELGGFAAIALPCDLKDHWKDFAARLPHVGLEVFNFSAIARNKINVPALALIWRRYRGNRPMRAFNYVSSRPRRELRLWDEIAKNAWSATPPTKVVGLASLDAHAVMRFGGKEYPYPTYEEVFGTLRTHIVTKEALSSGSDRRDRSCPTVDHDIQVVESSLAAGNAYMAYDNYADSKGFRFWSNNGDGTHCNMGDSVSLKSFDGNGNRLQLNVTVPARKGIIRLFRNGKLAGAARSKSASFKCSRPGVYRTEIFLYRFRIGAVCFGSKPWIFSNPIYVS